jgi:hypothetical protein
VVVEDSVLERLILEPHPLIKAVEMLSSKQAIVKALELQDPFE